MTFADFALNILSTPTLEAKLSPAPRELEDIPILAPSLPSVPARPKELAFGQKRAPFPKLSGAQDPKVRALMMHSFANHELQSIEMLALALLRFQDTPLSFRMELLKTLTDEQTHLRLYIERMNALGLQFGEHPVNTNFWDQVPKMDTPLRFMSIFSLTFECANLDFAWMYADLFKKVGDKESQALLLRIHADEIRHVKHGYQTLLSLKNEGQSEWEAYLDSLCFPITPKRARGPVFNRKGRELAGISDDFIARIQKEDSQNSRMPHQKLYILNANFEEQLQGIHDGPAKKHSEYLNYVFHLLANKEDFALSECSENYLDRLRKIGLPAGTAISRKNWDPKTMPHSIHPWGWSDSLRLDLSLSAQYPHPDFEKVKTCNSKIFSESLAQEKDWALPRSQILHSVGETRDWLKNFTPSERWILKTPFGVAGRGALHGEGPNMSDKNISWLQKHVSQGLVGQAWVPRTSDWSIQVEIASRGQLRILGICQMLNTPSGAFKAIRAGALQCPFEMELRESAGWVAERLRKENYQGPFGIDALAYAPNAFCPLLEINCRFTMGRIALGLARILKTHQILTWMHFHNLPDSPILFKELEKQGLIVSPPEFFPKHLSLLLIADSLEVLHEKEEKAFCLPSSFFN